MNKREAQEILQSRISELRRLSYDDLKARFLSSVDAVTVKGSSGAEYEIETEAIWDNRRRGHLRVMVAIDDGGLRALMPLNDSFIVAPDGTFIGE